MYMYIYIYSLSIHSRLCMVTTCLELWSYISLSFCHFRASLIFLIVFAYLCSNCFSLLLLSLFSFILIYLVSFIKLLSFANLLYLGLPTCGFTIGIIMDQIWITTSHDYLTRASKS